MEGDLGSRDCGGGAQTQISLLWREAYSGMESTVISVEVEHIFHC